MAVIDCVHLFLVLQKYSERQRGDRKIPARSYFASVISTTRDPDTQRWFAIYADKEVRRQSSAAQRTTGS